MAQRYVSAEWVDDGTGLKTIKAEGDDGKTYFVGDITSDVPPWPEFITEHGAAAITGEPLPQAAPA